MGRDQGIFQLNGKVLTIGAAITLALTTWISRLIGLVSDDQLIYLFWSAVIVAGSMAVSYGISWTATDGYKKYNWPPNRWREQAVKKKIFKVAWWSAGISMAACGFFALILTTTGTMLAVYSFGWLILSIFVAATSPWLWAFMADNAIPRVKKWVKGQDENEAEAEALNRPPEPK